MDKPCEALDFQFPNGAFRPLTATEPFQLYRLFESELPYKKKAVIDVPQGKKLLIVCTFGTGELSGNGRSVMISCDTVVACSNGTYELQSMTPQVKSAFLCLLFEVSPSQVAYTSAQFLTLSEYFNAIDDMTLSEDATEVRRCFLELVSELSLPESTMLLAKGSFYQTIIVAYRRFVNHTVPQKSDQIEMNAVGQTVYAIVRYIEEHLFSINNLMDMAKELGYSYNYLSHLFRRKTGITIQSYVTQKKIEQSTKLLEDEQYSITEIATMLNYDCIQSFSKAFRRAMGVSPTEYRSRIKR